MLIHVGRSGQQLGTFSPEQIRAALASGQLRPDDIAWHEGLADWAPLGSLVALLAPPPVETEPARAERPAAAPAMGTQPARGASAAPMEPKASAGSPWKRRIILWAVLALIAGIAVPLVPEARSKLAVVQHGKKAQSLVAVCKRYASEHEGRFPAQLEDLAKAGLVASEDLRCPFGKDDSPVGYHYYGNGVTDDVSGTKALLITRATDGAGKRLVARVDGTVESVILLSVPPAK